MTQLVRIAVALAVLGGSPAFAQDKSPFEAPVVAEADLRAIAGREDTTMLANADQVAGVSHNSVGNNSTTGEVRIADNAFQNLSGLSVVNVNTGNNVAINAAMNVNIAIVPRP